MSLLVAGNSANEAGNDGEALGDAEAGVTVEEVEENEREDAGLDKEPDDDGALED